MAKVVIEMEDIGDEVQVSATFDPPAQRDEDTWTTAQRLGMAVCVKLQDIIDEPPKVINGEDVVNAG